MNEQGAQWVVPNPQIPRTFGLLNIIFGALLLLVGAGSAAWSFIAPTLTKQIQMGVNKQQEERKADHDTKLAELKRREAAAKSEQEKQAVQDEITILEQDLEPDLSGMNDVLGWNLFSDVRVLIYTVAEMAAGISLNLLMIIAGAGLLALAEWARRLSIWVAWLKIVRWVAMTVVTMVLILPITLEQTQKAFQQVQAQAQVQAKAKSGGKTVILATAQMRRMMAIASAVFVVFEAVVASVYPALSLWFLTRPPARAACFKEGPSTKPPQANGPGQSW